MVVCDRSARLSPFRSSRAWSIRCGSHPPGQEAEVGGPRAWGRRCWRRSPSFRMTLRKRSRVRFSEASRTVADASAQRLGGGPGREVVDRTPALETRRRRSRQLNTIRYRAGFAAGRESRFDERDLHPGRQRRDCRGSRTSRSTCLAASQSGDRVGTGGADDGDEGSGAACDAALRIEDAGERRRAVALSRLPHAM